MTTRMTATALRSRRSSRARRASARCYRWLALALAVLLLAIVAVLADRASGSAALLAPEAVVVAPGETVWDLSARYLPAGRGLADYVAEVVDQNAVDPLTVAPGTVLYLPSA